jgi:membrane protein YdbS with pleckstrin-like domain
MTNSENWAWWTLGVIALTLIAFFALVAILRNVPASQSAFALMALMALHPRSWRKFKGPQFDEREKEIAEKAQLAAFRAVWVVFIGLVMTIGFVKGWNATLSVPVWMLSSAICWALILVLTVESVTTLVLYRRG